MQAFRRGLMVGKEAVFLLTQLPLPDYLEKELISFARLRR